MTGPANRGKYAEGKVRDHLVVLSDDNASFTFNRNPDAHAAGGRFVPVAGDFQAFRQAGTAYMREVQMGVGVLTTYTDIPVRYSRNFIIEVKEVAHAFRLPYKNYSTDKVGRVKAREWAGSECLVLVCHRLPKQKPYWRAVPQSFFYDRDPAKPSGSWDLSAFPIVDHKVAINQLVGLEAK